MVRDTISITEWQVVEIAPIVAALSCMYPRLPRQLIVRQVMEDVVLEGGEVVHVREEAD